MFAKPNCRCGHCCSLERAGHEGCKYVGKRRPQDYRCGDPRSCKYMPAPSRGLQISNLHRSRYKPASELGSRRRSQDSLRGNVGGPKDPINSSALLQQVCWKWFANEFCMTLGARDYNSFVVRYACDPFPIKSLALEELFETDGIKCHDQDIADFLPRQ